MISDPETGPMIIPIDRHVLKVPEVMSDNLIGDSGKVSDTASIISGRIGIQRASPNPIFIIYPTTMIGKLSGSIKRDEGPDKNIEIDTKMQENMIIPLLEIFP